MRTTAPRLCAHRPGRRFVSADSCVHPPSVGFESLLGLQNRRSEHVYGGPVARLACLVDHPLRVNRPRGAPPLRFVVVRRAASEPRRWASSSATTSERWATGGRRRCWLERAFERPNCGYAAIPHFIEPCHVPYRVGIAAVPCRGRCSCTLWARKPTTRWTGWSPGCRMGRWSPPRVQRSRATLDRRDRASWRCGGRDGGGVPPARRLRCRAASSPPACGGRPPPWCSSRWPGSPSARPGGAWVWR